jgi:hypothetical protein
MLSLDSHLSMDSRVRGNDVLRSRKNIPDTSARRRE